MHHFTHNYPKLCLTCLAFLLFSYAARLCKVSNNSVQSSYVLKCCTQLSGFLPSAFYKHNKGRSILKCGKLKRRMVCVMLLPLLTFAQWSLLIGILLVKLITCLPSSKKYRRFTNQPGMEIYMHNSDSVYKDCIYYIFNNQFTSINKR